MKTVGIIGFGSFGQFIANNLGGNVDLHISSSRPDAVPEQFRSSFNEVAQCDYIIPAIPLEKYEEVLSKLSPIIAKHSVIVDICSVKIQPVQIISKVLPNNKIVATHPLFGPESAAKSLQGHIFVVCNDISDKAESANIANYVEKLGLKVLEMSAEKHDKEMAIAQGLTFFIAQTLVDLGLHDVTLHTPSFLKLLDLANLERHHSAELFQTIQKGNPYTEKIRQKYVDEANKLNKSLQ